VGMGASRQAWGGADGGRGWLRFGCLISTAPLALPSHFSAPVAPRMNTPRVTMVVNAIRVLPYSLMKGGYNALACVVRVSARVRGNGEHCLYLTP